MALLNEFTADTDISLVDALILQKHTLVVKKGNKKLYEGKLTKFLYKGINYEKEINIALVGPNITEDYKTHVIANLESYIIDNDYHRMIIEDKKQGTVIVKLEKGLKVTRKKRTK